MLSLLLLTLLVGSEAQFWDILQVSFPRYNNVPRTVVEAEAEGWTELTSGCNGNLFSGRRYVRYDSEFGDYDYAVIPIYDVSTVGFIAGMQTAFPSDFPNSRPPFPPPSNTPPMVFDSDLDLWIQTAYFVDPALICTTGRSQADFDTQGTGDRIVLQYGEDLITIPATEAEANDTLWSYGQCFPGMGQHFWYNIRNDMSCDEIISMFLLYDPEGRLYAFGFSFFGTPPGPGYERTTGSNMALFFPDDMPDCLLEYPHLTSFHVFMSSTAALNFCL